MVFNLSLPDSLRKARWKVKIRDKETREPPHVTIICKTKAWRINLRTGQFIDNQPNPADVPDEILDIIFEEETSDKKTTWEILCNEWDSMYPKNPVIGEE